jgi:hypothetical protein
LEQSDTAVVEKKEAKVPKTKHRCSCGKVFPHRYLLERHVKVLRHDLCPVCFGPTKVRSGEGGDMVACTLCSWNKHFPPTMLARMNEDARSKHYAIFHQEYKDYKR